MNLQTTLNILQSRGWALAYQNSAYCIYNSRDQHFIVPIKSVGQVPAGTLDTIFRSVYTPKDFFYQNCNQEVTSVPVILEKQDDQVWGRIEQQGFLAIACGDTREIVTKMLILQLTEFSSFLPVQSCQKAIPSDFVVDYHYDMALVRELFQQFKLTYLAEHTKISQDLLSQFMMSKQYPSTQQAQKIEALIQQFGRDMLNFSLL